MKITLFLIGLFSFNAFAGSCQLEFGSRERGRLPFMSVKRQTIQVASLDVCVRHAQNILGKTIRATTPLRDEQRVLTVGEYRYSDGKFSASGKINLH